MKDKPQNTFYYYAAYNCGRIGVRYFDDQKERPPAPDRQISFEEVVSVCEPVGNCLWHAAINIIRRLRNSPGNIPVYLFWVQDGKAHLMWWGPKHEFNGFSSTRYDDIRVGYKSGEKWHLLQGP
jgi:hypothetical protein